MLIGYRDKLCPRGENYLKSNFYTIEGPWPGRLANLSRPRGDDWLKDELTSWVDAEIDVIVSLLTAQEISDLALNEEETISQQLGIEFINYPIPDYDVPVSSTSFTTLVDALSDLLSRGKSIGIHCRQSVGRSSLLVACLLDHFDVSVDDGFERIAKARGVSVPDTTKQRQWVIDFSNALKPNKSERHVS
jgi:hypothetical protein